jgi:chemotaxis protein CheZ
MEHESFLVQPASSADSVVPPKVYNTIGSLTRQLHDALSELGYADQLRGTVDKLPDAKSRLSYISRLTGEAAEKVLNRVEMAKSVHDEMAAETRRMAALIVKDPVAAVAKGEVMNFVDFVQQNNATIDQHLTEIMMAQDFHDLTGQVIARVVNLATTIEDQLVELLIQTSPGGSLAPPVHAAVKEDEGLIGPQVQPEGKTDVVTDQSQVDDLLASLGF